jgi:Fic family protein
MKNLTKISKEYQALTGGIIDYHKFNVISIIHHSSVIEGSRLTEQETSLLLDESLSPKNKPMEDVNLVIDHYKAIKHILDLAEKKEKLSVSKLQKVAGIIVDYKYGDEPVSNVLGDFHPSKGEFRNRGIRAGEQTFMDHKKVPGKVSELIEHINNKIDSVEGFEEINNLAFDSHFNLVTIHPFADGNGRISRLLMNYIQHYHKSPLTRVLGEDKMDYYGSLMKTRADEDISAFRGFMYGQAEKQFLEEINLLKVETKKNRGMSFLF